MPVEFRFDYRSPQALEAARAAAADLVTGISAEMREGLRVLVMRGLQDGIPPAKLARLMQDSIGLNARQAAALVNYRATLEGLGGLSEVNLNKQILRYRDRMLRRRKMTIARTETMDALNEGKLQAAIQAQDDGLLGPDAEKEWDAAPENTTGSGGYERCDVCAGLDGERRPLREPFSNGRQCPTAHPNCRCTIRIHPGNTPPAPSEEPTSYDALEGFDEDEYTQVEDLMSELRDALGVSRSMAFKVVPGTGRLEDGREYKGILRYEYDAAGDLTGRRFVDLSPEGWNEAQVLLDPHGDVRTRWRGLQTILHELGHAGGPASEYAGLNVMWEEGVVEARARLLADRIMETSAADTWSWAYKGETEAVLRLASRRGVDLQSAPALVRFLDDFLGRTAAGRMAIVEGTALDALVDRGVQAGIDRGVVKAALERAAARNPSGFSTLATDVFRDASTIARLQSQEMSARGFQRWMDVMFEPLQEVETWLTERGM